MAFDELDVDYTNPREVYKLPEVQEKLLSAKCKILLILLDFKPHSTDELMKRTGAKRIASRINELRHKHGLPIRSWADPSDPTVWYYQLVELPYNDPFWEICHEKIEEWWGKF